MNQANRFRYIEQTLKALVSELKQKNCLSQDFEFLTEAEQKQKLEQFVDDFVRTADHQGPFHLVN